MANTMRMTIELLPEVETLPPRAPAEITGIVVHRIQVSQEDPSFRDTAEDTARFFRDHPVGIKATGGKMPYPIIVERGGCIVQLVPLTRTTPHAVVHNRTTIGIGCMGDFRTRAPEPAQWHALVDTCAMLLTAIGRSADAIAGHDELAGGSHVADKECPGRFLSIQELRAAVERAPRTAMEFAW